MIPIEEVAAVIRAGIAGYTGMEFRESSDQDENGGDSAYLVLEFTDVMENRGHPIVEYAPLLLLRRFMYNLVGFCRF